MSDENQVKSLATQQEKLPGKWFSGNLVPRTFDEALKMAQTLCKSGLVPKDMINKPEACLMAIGFGMEIGLPPMQALQNIMVVNGRPSIWGDAALALVFDSGLCQHFDEDSADKALKQGFGRCHVQRSNGMDKEVRFSVEDAKKARLWIKQGPWQEYPGRMLQMRARSWALRDAFPDVLKGLSIREEANDIPGQPKMPQEVGAVPAKEAEIIEAQKIEDPEPANPANQITLDQRQEVFKLLQESKIPLAEWKEYVIETFGVQSSAEITQGRFPEVVEWIKANKVPEVNS